MQNVNTTTSSLLTPSPTTSSLALGNMGLRRSSRLFGNAAGPRSTIKVWYSLGNIPYSWEGAKLGIFKGRALQNTSVNVELPKNNKQKSFSCRSVKL